VAVLQVLGLSVRLQSYDVCGVAIAAVGPAEAQRLVVSAAQERRSLEVHLCNTFTLSLVAGDPLLAHALARSDLNLADGTPVAWLGRSRGMRGPVRGPGLMRSLLTTSEGSLAHYLYGGAPGVADQLIAAFSSPEESEPMFAGAETPPYTALSDDDVEQLAGRIRISGANVVWIGLGTPKQDYLVPRLAPLVSCPVLPVGAAFDFLTGRVEEAPPALHASGLEWAYRLGKEPGRLWSRYLIGGPRFLVHAYRARSRV
jgi:N-acetylglucosaminyldiphosphoundecaprenol N-acetyl-beta-D-mannosaminyltransferase